MTDSQTNCRTQFYISMDSAFSSVPTSIFCIQKSLLMMRYPKGGTNINMTQIEVPRILANATRISDQLDTALGEKRKMYAKTRRNYEELAISLLSSVDKIATLLENNSLCSLDDTPQEFHTSSVDVNNLRDAIDKTSKKINSYTSFVSPPVSNDANINRDTLKRYGSVLNKASTTSFSCIECSECAYILNRWFKARFSNKRKSSSFKYNISYLPEWITNIIILYGKYHSNGDSDAFMNMMTSWCDSLDHEDCKWAVPYEVHQLTKSFCPEDYTMDAVLIGDILMDEALYELTESNSPGIVTNLDCYPVASRVKMRNAGLLPIMRSRLAKRDSLLNQYHLTSSERRNKN